jgi:hypothetical protein
VNFYFYPTYIFRAYCPITYAPEQHYFHYNIIISSNLVAVVECRRVSGGLEIMGCYLEGHQASVDTRAARASRRTAQGRDSSGHAIRPLENLFLCAAVLAVLLVIGGVEQNPKPGVETENFKRIVWRLCQESEI